MSSSGDHSITAKGKFSRKFTTIPRGSQHVDIHRELEDDVGRGTRFNELGSSHLSLNVPKSEVMQPHFPCIDLGYNFESSSESLDDMGSREKERRSQGGRHRRRASGKSR